MADVAPEEWLTSHLGVAEVTRHCALCLLRFLPGWHVHVPWAPGRPGLGGVGTGSLIVHQPPWAPLPDKYDAELAVILNDWWHRSVTEQVSSSLPHSS